MLPPLHIGAGDIDGEHIHKIIKEGERLCVVTNYITFRSGGCVLRYTGANNSLRMVLFDTLDSVRDSFIIDSHPVNQCLVFGKTEKTRAGIAILGLRGERPDLHKRETEP